MYCFVLIRQLDTDTSPLAAQVTPEWLARTAAGLTKDLQQTVAQFWPEAAGAVVRVGSGPSDVGPDEIPAFITPTTPEPGAIAYHSDDGSAKPFIVLALDTVSTLQEAQEALSHEFDETIADAPCNRWADNGAGEESAFEICDPVESNSYPVDLGDGGDPVWASDFVLPAFFSQNASGPYCYLALAGNAQAQVAGTPSAPFAVATGGYEVERTATGSETQVTAKVHPVAGKRGARVQKGAHPWTSRTARRGVLPVNTGEADAG